MRARSRQESDELVAHNFYRNAHMRGPALATTEPPFAAPSRLLVTFLSRLSVVFRGELGNEDGLIDLLTQRSRQPLVT